MIKDMFWKALEQNSFLNKVASPRIILILTLLADFFLFTRIGTIKPYTLFPFELLVLIATPLFLFQLFKQEEYALRQQVKKYSIVFFFILSLLFLGSVLGGINYHYNHEILIAAVKDFYFLITVFLGFILHLYICRNKKNNNLVFLSLSSPLLFSFFLLFPNVTNKFQVVGQTGSISGLSGNPSVFATFLLVPLAVSIHYLLGEKRRQKIVSFITLTLSFVLLLWTGSRAAWIASIIIFLIGSFFSFYHSKYNIYKVATTALVVLCSFSLAATLLPQQARKAIINKITDGPLYSQYQVVSQNTLATMIKRLPLKSGLLATQNRQEIWPKAVQMIPRYPFGLGVQYAQLSKNLHEPDGRSVPAHNIFLQSALSGGWLLLITLVVLLFLISKKSLMQKDSQTPLVFSLWVGVLLVSVFNDFLFSIPLLWILAGIILSEQTQINKK